MTILSKVQICKHKGLPVWLQEIKDNSPPDYAKYCVQYAGNGHYFPNKVEALAYLHKRRFIKP